MLDDNDSASLIEVTQYYRELYGILSEQANRQVEQVKLHVRKLLLYGQPVLGDEHMLHYLFELLGVKESRGDRQEANPQVASEVKDAQYVVFRIAARCQLTEVETLLTRQIVRDHGEATNRHACGISVEDQQVTIILPRYNGKV